MSTWKYFDIICCVILILIIALTILFINGERLGIEKASSVPGYENKLFDTSKVHTINIVMDNWDDFIESCSDEEYANCSVIIDNEAYKNVAIRAKGNTSLSNVKNYGNNRYSFKIEFDHYDSSKSYYGLDKLNLNNIIQDNTYMKDYLTYQMMSFLGVNAPLCSYVQVLVNGEEWGLYLAIEGIEESFLSRNFGNDYGELYKPDSVAFDGGEEVREESFNGNERENFNPFGNDNVNTRDGMPFDKKDRNFSGIPNQQETNGPAPFSMNSMNENDAIFVGQSDVLLIYSDDEYSSYSNIFDNAKADISNTDKERLISALKDLNENNNIDNVVNVDEVIRYFVVHNFVCNFDSYTGSMIHNYYLYEKDGQLSMIPWDYNLAFGGFVGDMDATTLVNYPIDTPVLGSSVESRPMLSWIFQNEEYENIYHQYFYELISDYFDSDYFSKMIDDLKEMLSPYVESDPTKFCTYEEFEKGIDTLKLFCILRAKSIKAQLEGTIGSTFDEQDEDTFIDASTISILDMGSMDNGRMNMFPNNDGMNDFFLQESKMQGQYQFDSENMIPPQTNGETPMMPSHRGDMQSFPVADNRQGMRLTRYDSLQPDNQIMSTNSDFIILVICILSLVLGVVFVFLYKKRE